MSGPPVDLPNLDSSITLLPEDFRKDISETALGNLYVFGKSVMGFSKMTIHTHGPLCVFIDHNKAQFKLMMMPRDTFKTSVVTISANTRLAVRNPNERILIGNEGHTNAQRFLRGIRETCENNKVFRALYSHVIPRDTRKTRWNDTELQFVRTWNGPEPTFDTIGMTGGFTSRHYTHICWDDVISEEAARSDKVMRDTTERVMGFRSLLVEPEASTCWWVGTHWSFADTYVHVKKTLGPRVAKFIRGILEDGQSIFPELMNLSTIAEIRHEQGEYKFSCLYMNNPRNPEVQDFNIQDLKFFAFSPDERRVTLYDREGNEFRTWLLSQLDITITVDLAAAEKVTSDRNAVSTCGVSPEGDVVVLDSWAKRCTPLEVLSYLLYLQRRFSPRAVGIEDVAYQKSFKYFLKDSAEKQGIYLNVKPIRAIGKKETRIRGLQPVVATGRVYILPTQMILRNEMSDFPLGEHDDALDSLSMQLQLWTNQMSLSRWNRYKESERRVLGDIDHDRRLLRGELISASSDEVDDLLPSPPQTSFFLR